MVKIITCVVNRPGFIEIQHLLMKKHFKFEYEFIVFNDAKSFPDVTNGNDPNVKNKIHNICTKYDIQCIDIPNDHHRTEHSASVRNADSVNFVLEYQKANPDKYLVLDSDMFPIADFDIERYAQFDAAVVLQERNNVGIKYFWCGLYYFDMNKMKDVDILDWSVYPGCDVGGSTHKWLNKTTKKHIPSCDVIRISKEQFIGYGIYYIRHFWSLTWDENELPDTLNRGPLLDFLKNDERNQNNKFYCELYDNAFLHYRNGSNWDNSNVNFFLEKQCNIYKELAAALEIDII